jgi:hypothetical protein
MSQWWCVAIVVFSARHDFDALAALLAATTGSSHTSRFIFIFIFSILILIL